MTQSRIEACYFEAGQGPWSRLARVLDYSARRSCPEWDVRVERIQPKMIHANARSSFKQNTQKLDHWAQLVEMAPEGDRIVLMDADTMVLRSLDDVWDKNFDFAYTTKSARFPFNAGVIFLRVSDPVRVFVREWSFENRRLLLQDPHKGSSQGWRQKYAGINQGALANMLAVLGSTIRIETLPCAEWNCEDSAWATFNPAVTRVVHVKSALRVACLGREQPNGPLAPLVTIWRELDHEAAREVRVA